MPRGKDENEPHHLAQKIDAITSYLKSLNSRLAVLTDEQLDSLTSQALAMHQESRISLALTHGLVDREPPAEVPFT